MAEVVERMSVILTADELVALTTYTQPARQLRELHRQGFSRARIGRTGAVILERVHYLAVIKGNAVEPPFDYTQIIPRPRIDAGSERRAQAIRERTPAWADRDAIEAIYDEARRLSQATGVPHHVDHDYPVRGELVSGLHVHQNLRILTGADNLKKSNSFEIEL